MNTNNGLCECGCGDSAPICKHTDKRTKDVKGEPCRFIFGHQAVGHRYRFKDLTGQTFRYLTALECVGTNRQHQSVWLCLCKCGRICLVAASSLGRHTTSCGCYLIEIAPSRRRTHGMTTSSTYESWHAMKQRCTNPNKDGYHRYGGRGVCICTRWLNSFEAFLKYLGPRPKGKTIDRINPNGHYVPGNVRWATPKQQRRNQSKTKGEPVVPFVDVK